MQNENRNEEAVSPVIATILMVRSLWCWLVCCTCGLAPSLKATPTETWPFTPERKGRTRTLVRRQLTT